VTEFVETAMRHFCRNPKCRSKLPTPVSNSREAFCARGCHTSFYLHRCRVCEAVLPKTTGKGRPRVICKKPKCRNAWIAGEGFGKYANLTDRYPPENAANIGGFERGKADPRWHIVAGEISAKAFHCAIVPDGPNCQWKGGEFDRVGAKNRQILEQHFARLDAAATDNCATCGAGEDLVDHKPDPHRPERTVRLCRPCRDKGRDHVAKLRPDLVIQDDLNIPSFLDRRPKAEPLAA
jgi:hypothetical protein